MPNNTTSNASHTDKLGQTIRINDYVVSVHPRFKELIVGKVTSITPKTLVVEYQDYKRTTPSTKRCFPEQIVKINPKDATLYKLQGMFGNI